MKRRFVAAALLVILAAANLASGAGMILVEDSSLWRGPLPPGPIPPPWPGPRHPLPWPHRFAPLEVASVEVHTEIQDQIALTSIDQEFRNPNSTRLEGTFIFPIPKGAHLDKFAMEIDGKKVAAELLTAEKARGIYEDIVRRSRDPALLEYAGQDMYKVRIFPIEPNSRKRISLSYTQLLKSDDGLVSYALPLSTEKFSCEPVKNLAVKVTLKTSRPLKSVYSPTHTVVVKRDGANRATAAYEATDVQGDADFALYFAAEKDELGLNLLTHRVAGEDGYFLLLASPGIDSKDQKVIPKDIVFVLDTSGSMAGKKLNQAKKALQFCVENLNEDDRFEVIRFSTEVDPLFNQLVTANHANRERAQEFVDRLKPLGATAIDDALRKALGLQSNSRNHGERIKTLAWQETERPFVLIFLTDGRPTIGVTDEEQIVANVKKENDGHTRVFCFGIGTDVNTHLLDKITEETRGFSQYVLPEEDLELKVSSFYSKIKEPVLTNPTLTFSGDVRPAKLYPSALPDFFKGEQLVLVGRYSGSGDSAAVLEGTINGGTRKFAHDVNFAVESSANEFIPRLWATRRVGYLLDEIRLHGENAELRDEITELARRYCIVTPYTSYLIVEDEQRREVPVRLRSMPELERNQNARAEAAKSWQQFTTERGGDAGVAGALSGMALKTADAAAPAALGAEAQFARRYGLASSSAAAGRADNSAAAPNTAPSASTPSRFVGGKTFFQNGSQWVDTTVQRMADTTPIRIQFGSTDYFKLLAKNPAMAAWLALGREVQFVWNNQLYEVYE
jgi:Ca-activated chloride channel homolog